MSPVRQELIAYSQKQRGNNQILRTLLECNTWYAPAGFAAITLGRTKFDRLLQPIQNESLPAGAMIYFTDFEAAERANLPVAFAGEIAGVDLIDILDSQQLNRLDINYGLPTAETFYAGVEAFPLLKRWSATIRFERQLNAAAYEGAAFPFRSARQHPGFLVVVEKADNRWHTLRVNGLEGDCAVAFTAPDHLEAYVSKLDPQTRESIGTVEVPGERLFTALSGSRLAGVTMNVGITIPAVLFQPILTAE
jgi:hypothetical protein